MNRRDFGIQTDACQLMERSKRKIYNKIDNSIRYKLIAKVRINTKQ